MEAVLPVEGSTDGWTNGGLSVTKEDTYDEGTSYVSYHTGNLTVDNPLTISDGSKRTIFVKGNVTIDQNIIVPIGSFFSIIATGNLTITGNVTKVQGVYIVDKTITVEDIPDTVTGLNRQFESQGTMVGWQGVTLSRSLGEANNTDLAEQFTFRPDFITNAPLLYTRMGIQWREVTPGSSNP